jgi:uncharacterized membrane protein
MIPLLVLIVSLIAFRVLGAFGVGIFAIWQESTQFGLALMFVFTASAHFSKMKQDIINMVLPAFPFPKQIVLITGVLEIAGVVGILIPSLRSLAGICLVILMAAMFPGNIHAAKEKVLLRGKPPTPLWLRFPMQLVFMALTWWSTQS